MNKLTLRLSFLMLTLALCSAVTAQTYPMGQQDPIASGFTSATPFGTVDLNVGWQFKANSSDIVITRLGCNYPVAATSVTITLFDVTSQAVLAQEVVANGTGWTFNDLASPVALTNGNEYIITGLLLGTMPSHYHATPPASWIPTGDVELLDNVYALSTSPNAFPGTSIGAHYGVVDFGYADGMVITAPAQLPNAGDNTAYSEDLSVFGGTAPYIWSMTSGTLPSGLTLTQVGNDYRLAGTPATGTAGAYTFTVQLTDNASATDTKVISLDVDGISVVTTQAPDGVAGAAYSEDILAVNGTKPYTWTLASGTLPSGFNLAQVGNDFRLSGTPNLSAIGAYSFDVQVTDSLSATTTGTVSLYIDAPTGTDVYPLTQQDPTGFTIMNLSQYNSYQNAGWRFKANSDGITILRLGCNFPSGVSHIVTLFDVTTKAVIAQETCAPGSGWQFTNLATPVTLVNGNEYVIVGWNEYFYYYHNSPPTSWLPTGDIEYLGRQTGSSSGTASTYPTTNGAVDRVSGVVDFGYIKELNISSPPQLTNAGEMTAYSENIEADSGLKPYVWSLVSGTLPNGLTLTQVGDDFQLSGTPTTGAIGSYTFEVMVTDAFSSTKTETLTLDVDGVLVDTAQLADGTVGVAYSGNIQAVNGVGPYTWSLVSGAVPSGLSLTQVGNNFQLSGTPTLGANGTFYFDVQVTDSLSATNTNTVSVFIFWEPSTEVYPVALQDPTSSGFTILTSSSIRECGWKFKVNSTGMSVLRLGSRFPDGATVAHTVTLFDAATKTILAQEICGPGSGWQFVNLANPVALESGKEYVISGHTLTNRYIHTAPPASWTPTGDIEYISSQYGSSTTAGYYPSSSNSSLYGVVDFGYSKKLSIETNAKLSAGEEQVFYTTDILAVQGSAPYTWSLISGTLPNGLSLAQVGNNFRLSGTPATGTPGAYTLNVRVADSANYVADKTMTLSIIWPASAYIYPLTQQSMSGFSSYTNASSYQCGWRFKANSDGLVVWRLGSRFPDGASAPHTVTLFDVTTQAILAQEVCGPGSGWQFTELTSPVYLVKGREYAVVGFTSTGYYRRWNPPASWQPTGDIELSDFLFHGTGSTGSANTYPSNTNANYLWGVVDFGYFKSLVVTTDATMPTAAEQISYSANIQADYGTTPYTWTFSGTLPNGLSLAQVGNELQLSGTPPTGTQGSYTFDVVVTDADSETHTKTMILTVSPPPASMPFIDDFSTDTGWQYGADWTRGAAQAYNPTGGIQREEPGTDNTSASTDDMIAGHLTGADYVTGMTETVWLTSPPVNCSNATFVNLQFYRWLGVSLDSTAIIEVTNDGVNWVEVWKSPTYTNTQDAGWSLEAYDITATAKGNAVVQVRFGIGPTSTSTGTVNVGWCIDDIQIFEPGPELEVREGGLTGTLIVDDEAVGGLRDFGQIDDTSFSIITIALANTSASTVTISYSITQSGSGNFAFVNGQPPTSLAPNSSTTFDVMFLPQTAGVYNGTILMTHSASYSGSNPFSINLRGEGVVAAPVVQVDLAAFGGTNIPHQDPATVANTRDFGSVLVNGNSAPIDVAITNVGNTPLTITSIRIIGTWWNQFSLSLSGGMPVTLAANSSTTVSVVFQPTVPGIKDAYIEIVHNGTANPTPYEVPVLGTAVAAVPLIEVDDSSGAISHNDTTTASTPRDFGNILVATSSAPLTITVSNNGGSDLTLGAPALTTGAGEYSLDLTNFGTPPASVVIPVNSSITFDVIFTPTSAGVKDAQIEFTHNDNTVTSPFIINVTGIGVQAVPVIEVSNGTTVLANPGTLDFGSQDVAAGPTAAVVVSIENTGTAVLTLGIPVFNPASSHFILNTTGFPSSLAPNANTTFSITFDPAQEGALTAVIAFIHNDGSTGTPYILNLTGIGIAPKIEVREGSTTGAVVASGATATSGGGRDLGAIDISAGATGPITISLQNPGSLVLTLGTPTIVGSNVADFTLNTTGMATSLTVGADTSFTITFDPTLGGLKDAQIVFTHNDPTSPSPFIVPITGTAVDPNGVQITTTSLPQGTDSTLYIAVQLTAIQGSAPYTWSVYNGSLPNGLALSSNGLITGTPTSLTTNIYSFTVRVTDTTGATHEKALQIFVAGSAIVNLGFGNAGCAAGAGSQTWILILAMLSIAIASFKRRKRASE